MIYNFIYERDDFRTEEEKVKKALDRASAIAGIADAELSLMMTDDKGITSYNEQFRGKAGATDVLSFPFEGENPEGGDYLGDIVISVERVKYQAEELGHSSEAELVKLAVHGFLHLAGFDHQGSDTRMEEIEKEITGI